MEIRGVGDTNLQGGPQIGGRSTDVRGEGEGPEWVEVPEAVPLDPDRSTCRHLFLPRLVYTAPLADVQETLAFESKDDRRMGPPPSSVSSDTPRRGE